eukprot:gene10354-biopygen3491
MRTLQRLPLGRYTSGPPRRLRGDSEESQLVWLARLGGQAGRSAVLNESKREAKRRRGRTPPPTLTTPPLKTCLSLITATEIQRTD